MAYLGKTPSQATRQRYYFTASGSETSVSGADDNSNTLVFTDGNYIDVILNGSTLVAGTDYNTNTANTVSGLAALSASDIIEIVVYDTFSVFGGNVNGDFNFGDNNKAIFGAGNDLQIYHNATSSFVLNTNGELIIRNTSDDKDIYLQSDDGTGGIVSYLQADGSTGSVNLRNYGDIKLATTASGISVTGTVVADGLNIAQSAPIINITDSDTGVDHQINASSGVGNISIRTDVNGEASNGDFFVNTKSNNRLRVQGNGDISFYDNTGVSQGFYWDADQQSLGLGTTTPDSLLELYKAGTSELMIGSDNAGTAQLSFYEGTSSTKEGFLKYDGASNNVVLGTSGAANALVIARDTGNLALNSVGSGDIAVFKTTANSGTGLYINSQTTNQIDLVGYDGSAANAVNIRAGGATGSGLIINTSNNIGIGTSAPSYKLHSQTSVGSDFAGYFHNSASSGNGTSLVARGGGNNSTPNFQVQDYNGNVDFTVTGEGDVLIGTTNIGIGNLGWSFRRNNASFVTVDGNPSLVVKRGSNTGTAIEFVGPNSNSVLGNISVSTTAVSFNTTSDYRLKENVTAITSATDRLNQLNPVRFNFIADADTTVDGFLAHEAQAVVPEAVTGTHNEVDDDGDAVMQGIDQSKLVPLLTAALQEALTKIDQLETRITALEA